MDEAVFIAQYTFLATPAVIEEESRILGKIERRLAFQERRADRPFRQALLHRRQSHPGDSGEQAPCRAGSRPGIHTGEAPHPVRGVLPQALGGHGSSRRVRGDNRRL